jgi:hypothetical protein
MLEAPVGNAGHDLSAELMPALLEVAPLHVSSSYCFSACVVSTILPDLCTSCL